MKKVDFFHFGSEEAKFVAGSVEDRLGIRSNQLVLERDSNNIDIHNPIIVFNGDGFQHHLTKRIVDHLGRYRSVSRLPPFSYVHIDRHDDLESTEIGKNNTYESFVRGIIDVGITRGVYLLEEGLTGKRSLNPRFFVPVINGSGVDWGGPVERPSSEQVYVSIDFDVLDEGEGINHLFPQKKIGFDMPRLLWNIEELGRNHEIIGMDFVGFSQRGASEEYIKKSLDNISEIVRSSQKIIERV